MVYHPWPIIRGLSSVAYHPWSIIRRLSSVAYHPSPIIRRLSSVAYHPSPIIRRLSPLRIPALSRPDPYTWPFNVSVPSSVSPALSHMPFVDSFPLGPSIGLFSLLGMQIANHASPRVESNREGRGKSLVNVRRIRCTNTVNSLWGGGGVRQVRWQSREPMARANCSQALL